MCVCVCVCVCVSVCYKALINRINNETKGSEETARGADGDHLNLFTI